jgi:DNA-binding NarL/FixJ family response regulator/predicted ester cyclase
MTELTTQTTQTLLNCIDDLYHTPTLEQFPLQVLDNVEQLVGSDVSFCVTFQNQAIEIIAQNMALAFAQVNITPAYFQQHPVLNHHLRTNDWSAFKCSDFLTEQEYQRCNALYEYVYAHMAIEDFFVFSVPDSTEIPNPRSWSLQSIICEPDTLARVQQLSQQHRSLCNLGIHVNRNRRNFTEHDRTLLNLIRPHIHYAYRNLQQWAKLQDQIDQLAELTEFVGLIVLSPDMHIQQITDRAIRLLEAYFSDEWFNRHHLPESVQQYYQQSIAELHQPDLHHGTLPVLEKFQTNNRLVIRIISPPEQAEAILILEEYVVSNLSISSFRQVGLTKRESEILFYLSQGQTNKEIAQQLNREPATIRKHLEGIYEKLGVHDRTQAVSVALDRLGIIQNL